MDYVFAPSESRAQAFLRDNRFGLDDRAKVRLDYSDMLGEYYTEHDTLYILDGITQRTLTYIQMNVARSRTGPGVISVEER